MLNPLFPCEACSQKSNCTVEKTCLANGSALYYSPMNKDLWWKEAKEIASRNDMILTDTMRVQLDYDYCDDLSPREAIDKLQKNLRYSPSQSQPFVYTVAGT